MTFIDNPATLADYPTPQDMYLRKWSLILSAQNAPPSDAPPNTPQADSGPVPQIPDSSYNPFSGLVLTSDDTSFGLDPPTEGLRMKFKTISANGPTPASAIITIYNLANTTAANIVQEFNHVTLQAGYQQGKFGVIFDGIIKQYKRGHEQNMTESYLEIYAADGDLFHTQASLNTVLPAGNTPEQRRAIIQGAATQAGVPAGAQTPLQGATLPRARVFYGNATDEANDLAHSTGTTWAVADGKLIWTPLQGYIPGAVTVLNSRTGLIGYPEVTDEGISGTCLLDPTIIIKGLIQLDNAYINQINAPGGGLQTYFPSVSGFDSFAGTDSDGIYVVLVKSYEGDTRGGIGSPWYTHFVCIAQSAFSQMPTTITQSP